MTTPHRDPYVRGALATAQAFYDGQLQAAVEALLAAKAAGQPSLLAGGAQFLADSVASLRQAGVDLSTVPGLDERSVEFLNHGSALMQMELTACDPRDLVWRMTALTATMVHNRKLFAKTEVSVGEPATKAEPLEVRVVGMPDTRATQVVERDADGEILQTVTHTTAAA